MEYYYSPLSFFLPLSLSLPLLLLLLLLLLFPSTARFPHPNPLLGNLIPFLLNRRRFLDWAASLLARSPTATIRIRTPLSLSHGAATSNPLVVNHLLVSNFGNYVKGRRIYKALSDLLGDGLFIADGVLWGLQRKIASREFTTRSLRRFSCEVFDAFVKDRLSPVLSVAAESGEVIDLQDVLKRFAFDSICVVSFGHDPRSLGFDRGEERQKAFFDAFDYAVETSFDRLLSPAPFLWTVKRFLNVGSERKLREAIRVIDEYAIEIIESKEASMIIKETQNEDLLSRFMAAMEEKDGDYIELSKIFKGGKEKRRFFRDVIVSFILAGKDSTSSGLSWFFWLISINPKIEQRIYEEISLKDENCDYDELKGLNYLHAAITESLRLYPPVPINSRVVSKDDILPDGTKVCAGWFADYSAYAMGRDVRLWGPDCQEFKPDRWLDGKGHFVGADSCKFSVFHAGPRACLGREMAYVQMKAVALAVIRRFRIEVSLGEKLPQYEMAGTLRMKGGLPVQVKRR